MGERSLPMDELTMDEVLKRLKLGGDMSMTLKLSEYSNAVLRVCDDVLEVCVMGINGKVYGGRRLMTSELAVLELLLAVFKNAAYEGKTYVVMQ